jgi:hypothetical protein
MSHSFLGEQFREGSPSGFSPEEEWHGPYEVIKHPVKGTFHVVDNQGRAATMFDSDRRGRPTAENATASRDYIDQRQASREKANGLANKIFEGFAQTMGYADSDHMATTQRNRRDESFMLEHSDAQYDQDREQMVVRLPGKNGWYGKHTGAYTEIHHDKHARNVPVDAIPYYDGWPSREKAQQDLDGWVSEQGQDYEKNVLPYHRDQ